MTISGVVPLGTLIALTAGEVSMLVTSCLIAASVRQTSAGRATFGAHFSAAVAVTSSTG